MAARADACKRGTMLFDLATDPPQEVPIEGPEVERRMVEQMVRPMEENEAPPEQFKRPGLSR